MNIDLRAIAHRRIEIAKTVEQLTAEDAELARAEVVLRRLANRSEGRAARSSAAHTDTARRQAQTRKIARRKSQRDLVLAALREAKPPWLIISELLENVKLKYDVELPQKSISPLLTNLKTEGLIVRDGRRIAHAERVKGRH